MCSKMDPDPLFNVQKLRADVKKRLKLMLKLKIVLGGGKRFCENCCILH